MVDVKLGKVVLAAGDFRPFQDASLFFKWLGWVSRRASLETSQGGPVFWLDWLVGWVGLGWVGSGWGSQSSLLALTYLTSGLGSFEQLVL